MLEKLSDVPPLNITRLMVAGVLLKASGYLEKLPFRHTRSFTGSALTTV